MKKSCALLTHGGREAQRIGELSAGGTEIRVEATVAATRVVAQTALEGVEVGKDRLTARQVVPMGRIAPKLVRRVAPLSLVVVGKRESHPTLRGHGEAEPVGMVEDEIAQVLVVAKGLRMDVLVDHLIDRRGVATEIGTRHAIDIVGPRTAAVVSHLVEACQLHTQAQAARGASRREDHLEIDHAIRIERVAGGVETVGGAALHGDRIALFVTTLSDDARLGLADHRHLLQLLAAVVVDVAQAVEIGALHHHGAPVEGP